MINCAYTPCEKPIDVGEQSHVVMFRRRNCFYMHVVCYIEWLFSNHRVLVKPEHHN